MLLKDLFEADSTKTPKKSKKDKSADLYNHYVAGNMLFKTPCSGKLSGEKQDD